MSMQYLFNYLYISFLVYFSCVVFTQFPSILGTSLRRARQVAKLLRALECAIQIGVVESLGKLKINLSQGFQKEFPPSFINRRADLFTEGRER